MRRAIQILLIGVIFQAALPASAGPTTLPDGPTVTIIGSMVCNGACVPKPGPDDHIMVLFAIDGTARIRAEVEQIMAEFYPERGLDADAAERLQDQFNARLKYFIAPDSPALPPAGKKSHYCPAAAASAVTGVLWEKDGRRWITATRIEPARLKYPEKMLAADQPFTRPDAEPLVLKIDEKLAIKCIRIPPGRFLMGTPVYMCPYFQEEYPHMVTLTRAFYLAEIPVTQEMYESVMGENPSTVKDPQLPVQDPRFADIDKFCRLLSDRTGRKVRLPTDAEWEYAARAGTSNPGFGEKYKDQNSSGPNGFKTVLKVKSRQPNAWGLYDLASSWWEITADRPMYNVRHGETDPRYPPPANDGGKGQRSGRGIIKDGWLTGTHEFIGEKGYAGQKFRIAVEAP